MFDKGQPQPIPGETAERIKLSCFIIGTRCPVALNFVLFTLDQPVYRTAAP